MQQSRVVDGVRVMRMSTALGFDPRFDDLVAHGCPACAATSIDVEMVFRAADWLGHGGRLDDVCASPPPAFVDAVRVARNAQAELSAHRMRPTHGGGTP